MDGVRLGQAIRALRRHRDWTQDELARRARVSQASVSRAETGDASRLTVRTVERMAEALGARLSVRVYWHGEELDRLLDAAHAGIVDRVVASLVANGWEVLAGVDRKVRIAPAIAAERGWRVRTVSKLIVLPDDRTARRRVEAFASTFDRAFPARTRAVRRWIASPVEAMAGIAFLPAIQRTRPRHRVRPRERRPSREM